MLIGTGEQEGALSSLAVPASNDVSRYLGVGVTNVRRIVHVEDWRGDVEGLLHPVILGSQL